MEDKKVRMAESIAENNKEKVKGVAVPGADFTPEGDAGDGKRKRTKKPKKQLTPKQKTTRLVILCVVGALLLAGIITGGVKLYNIIYNPAGVFDNTPTPTIDISTPNPGDLPTPTPTLDPYKVLYNQADLSMMKDVVNILVIGVDYSVERETWDGKQDYHADVMMVIAVNFEENRVDLISLPRDTYAQIPGVQGIYKLNASINCGGGYNDAGFRKVMESASWMLGGIPVDYYYAVNMPTVKALANAIGGVDYDVEMDFEMAGRQYKKGFQHLDGQGVLDYMRVRKNIAASGDLNRINRQKKMMIALFNAMKERNLLLMIPDIVQAFQGQLHTNASLDKTMALALFAYNLDSENIGMHSISGKNQNIFGWLFCLTDQEKRVEIIEKVYGVKLKEYLEFTPEYANYTWESMLAEHYLEITEKLGEEVDRLINSGAVMPTPTPSPTPPDAPVTTPPRPTLRPSPTPRPTPTPTPTPTPGDTPIPWPTDDGGGRTTPEPWPTQGTSPTPDYRYTYAQYAAYWDYLDALEILNTSIAEADSEAERFMKQGGLPSDYQATTNPSRMHPFIISYTNLKAANERYKEACLAMAQAFGKHLNVSAFTLRYWDDPEFNEVDVDFR